MSILTRSLNLLNLGRILMPKHGIEALASLHTTTTLDKNWNSHRTGPQKWLRYNSKVFPPQTADEPPRPAVSQLII